MFYMLKDDNELVIKCICICLYENIIFLIFGLCLCF